MAGCRTFPEIPLGLCIGEHAGKILLIVLLGMRGIVSDASFLLAQYVCSKTHASHILVSVNRMMGGEECIRYLGVILVLVVASPL